MLAKRGDKLCHTAGGDQCGCVSQFFFHPVDNAVEHSGVAVRLTDVIAVAMDDVPGGMSEILHILKDASLNIEYMYACVGLVSGKALTVMRLSDSKKGEEVLRAAGYGKIKPEEIYRI